MYCHKCGNLMPMDSLFCAKCGARLLTDTGQFDTTIQKTSHQLNPKQIYFQKLAKILAKEEFRIDPRLLKKSDARKSIGGLLEIETSIASSILGLGPLGVLIGPVTNRLIDWGAISGEELYTALESVAQLFNIMAVKYDFGTLVILAVVDSDELDSSQAEARTEAFCEALWRIAYKRNTSIITNCLYVFFDEQQCARTTPSFLKKGYKQRTSWWKQEAYVNVWPIVANIRNKRGDCVLCGVAAQNTQHSPCSNYSNQIKQLTSILLIWPQTVKEVGK